MATYVARLAAAYKAEADATSALKLALRRCEISPEIHAVALDRDPVRYAVVLREIATVMERLPGLRDEAEAAAAALARLREQACYRCDGTGVYAGPTSARRSGVPYCFYCNGVGTEEARRATSAR